MKEEISKVLSMMQEGKIDSDKASELIDAEGEANGLYIENRCNRE